MQTSSPSCNLGKGDDGVDRYTEAAAELLQGKVDKEDRKTGPAHSRCPQHSGWRVPELFVQTVDKFGSSESATLS